MDQNKWNRRTSGKFDADDSLSFFEGEYDELEAWGSSWNTASCFQLTR